MVARARIAFLNSLAFTFALAARIIIDDSDLTHWSYSGTSWIVITPSTPCPTCGSQPDPTKTFNNTWHDNSGPDSAHLTFSGTAIEIYTICPTFPVDGYGFNYTFTLDSEADGIFRKPKPACSRFMYNYLAYSRRNLSRGDHTFVITNSPSIGTDPTTLLLDYAIYDNGIDNGTDNGIGNNTSSQSPNRSLSVAAFAGTIAGMGVLLLGATAVAIWFYRRARKTPIQPDAPFVSLPPSNVQYNLPSTSTPIRSSFHQSPTDSLPFVSPAAHSNVVQPTPEPGWQPNSRLLNAGATSLSSTLSAPPGTLSQSARVFSPPPLYAEFGDEPNGSHRPAFPGNSAS